METKRFETIQQEMRKMQNKPSINTKSKQYKTLTKPLYTRVKKELEKKKTALDNLKQIYNNKKLIEEHNNQ